MDAFVAFAIPLIILAAWFVYRAVQDRWRAKYVGHLRCAFCGSTLRRLADGSRASTCARCGRLQPWVVSQF